MAVIRVEKNKNYTVMANYHLRDKNLSCKAKGLLSMILSLPEDWNYSVRGLAAISKESVGGINSILKELERTGYLTRTQPRDENGKMGQIVYTAYEEPRNMDEESDSPCIKNPHTVKPDAVKPDTEEPYMEFKQGRYKENLTVEEAMEAYRQIEHARGIKGIGVHVDDGEWGLVNGKSLNLDDLKYVPQIASNLEVQQAIKTIYQNMPELTVVGKEEYLKNAEILLEDDYGMIDGIINNGPKEEQKPSIMKELKEAKEEAKAKNMERPEKSHEKKHGQEL